VTDLIQENQLLGSVIEQLRSKVQTKSGIEVEELEATLLDLH